MNLDFVKEVFDNEMQKAVSHPYKETGNKHAHGLRTANVLKQLCAELGYEYDDTLIVAAWFHDICNGQENHEIMSAEKTVELLKDYCDKRELDEIYSLISVHDSRKLPGLTERQKLLQDADLLDHFGTFTVWTWFFLARKNDWSILRTADEMRDDFTGNYNKYVNLIHFDLTKKLFNERENFTDDFISRLKSEGEGKIDFDKRKDD